MIKNINNKHAVLLGVLVAVLGLFVSTNYAQANVVGAIASGSTPPAANSFFVHSPNLYSFQNTKTYRANTPNNSVDLAVVRYVNEDFNNNELTWSVVEEKYDTVSRQTKMVKVTDVGGVFPETPLKMIGKARAEMIHYTPSVSTGRYHFEVCLTSKVDISAKVCKISKSFKIVNDPVPPSSPLPNPSATPRPDGLNAGSPDTKSIIVVPTQQAIQ